MAEGERTVTKYEVSHGKTVLTNARDWHSGTFQCMDDVKSCEYTKWPPFSYLHECMQCPTVHLNVQGAVSMEN
jgi:hypothetical protein